MDEEKIEQKVTVSDQAQTGDITLIGKIVNIIQQPSALQEVMGSFLSNLGRFLSTHRYFLLAALVLEIALVALYVQYRNLYLIPSWRWRVSAALLIAASWGWYTWMRFEHGRARLAFTVLTTLALGGVIGWQTWVAVSPEQFPPEVFGIAVAELGEGADFQLTAKTREISDQVYEHLCQAMRQEFVNQSQDPCGANAKASEPGEVHIRRIGVMPDSQTAQAYGEQIQADFVIWGQVLASEKGTAVIRFQVIETLDKAVNPEFPLALPVTSKTADIAAPELDIESDPVQLKKVVAQQCTIISSFTLGLIAYLGHDFVQAVRHFEITDQTIESSSSLEVSPNGKGLLYLYLGRTNNLIGQIDEGQEWLIKAQEANPEEPAIPLSLALGYGSLGYDQEKENNLDLALDLVEAWLDTHPEDNAAMYDRGLIYQIREQYEDAALDYEAIIKSDPDYYVAYINLGQVTSNLRRFEQAENALQSAIALADESGSNPAWAYLNLAVVYTSAEEPKLAKPAYMKAIEYAPKVGWMYYYYARFLESQQEIDAALLTYQTMTEVTWNKGWAYGQLAGFRRRHGLGRVIEYYKKAIHEEPENALLRTYLAETYFELGQVDNALQAFEEAIECAEGLYYVYGSYGWVLFSLGNFERAAQMYEKSLELRPIDQAVLLNLGQTYENLGQQDKAKELYLRILDLSDYFLDKTIREAQDRLEALDAKGP